MIGQAINLHRNLRIEGLNKEDQMNEINEAHARRFDPFTSHEAAASMTPLKLTANRKAVLGLFAREAIPMNDECWIERYQRSSQRLPLRYPQQSLSGLRSRRSELVTMGLLKDIGTTKVRNRKVLIWDLTPAGQEYFDEMVSA